MLRSCGELEQPVMPGDDDLGPGCLVLDVEADPSSVQGGGDRNSRSHNC